MLKRLYFLFVTLLMISGQQLSAQTERFFSGDEQLDNSMINDIYQDHWGRMWIATQNGLTCYDSYQFRTYHVADGLLSDNVTRLMGDKNNDIIVGTAKGVQRFSSATLQFQTIQLSAKDQDISICNVNALLRRQNGDILIATSGVGVFVLKPGVKEARYSDELMYDELIDVKDMKEAEDGTLWMAAAKYGVVRITQSGLESFLIGQQPMDNVCIAKDGTVYACGLNSGVFQYDKRQNAFVPVKGTESMTTGRLTNDANGDVLVATEGHGVCRIVKGKLITTDSPYKNICIAREDRDGNLWTGVSQKGLLLQVNQKSSFNYIGSHLIGDNTVSAIFRDSDGVLWVGTNGDGLYKIEELKNGKIERVATHYTHVPASILCITEDSRGQLYIGSWLGGCGRLDKSTGRYEQMEATAKGDAIHVMSLVVDNDDNLWVATNGDGLKCINLQTGGLTHYKAMTIAEPTGQENELSNAWVSGLSLSPDGRRLYLALSSGIGCMDLATRNFVKPFGRNFLLPDHAFNIVREDCKGKVWAAASDGLYIINPKDGSQKCLTVADGLPSNDIVSLEFDSSGALWIGTLHGLCCYDTEKGECTNYFKADGLQGNEFFKGASAFMNNGQLAFGGTGGLTLFRPQEIVARQMNVRVQLMGMTVSGQEVSTLTRSGWYQVCDTIVSEAKRFDLAYNDNNMTLYFSTMDYARTDGQRYEYRIGAEGAWQRLPMGVNTLTLSHLAPDTYSISVRAVRGSTVSEELTFTVVVHPAWYASIYAKIVYCLLVLLMIVRYLHRRRRAEQQRLRVQEHIHAAQMREIEEGNGKEEVQASTVETHSEGVLLSTEDHAEKTQQIVEEMIEKPTLQAPDERLLERVMKVVNAHITDSDLSVEQIANEVGLSRSHLHRKMKELTGESTSDFVRNVRLKRAAYLLEGGKHSIAEVMYACGFDSPPGFSTRFKNFYGVSPSEYMKEHSYGKPK